MADKDPLVGLGKDLKILLNPKIGIIFSLLFSIHSLWYGQGEFVQQSQASLVVDHFPYSRCLYVDSTVILKGEIRCQSLLGVKGLTQNFQCSGVSY